MKGKWFDQLVICILENHGFNQVIGCDFVKWLTNSGTVFSNWYSGSHPSGPCYRTLFSGIPWSSNEFDNCWRPSILDNVPNVTISFAGTPADRHNPAKDMHGRMSTFTDYTDTDVLPVTIGGMEVPTPVGFMSITYLGMDDQNDAHSGTLEVADANVMKAIDWWQKNLPDALFVCTFDEAFGLEYLSNRVFMGMAGKMVPKGKSVKTMLGHSGFARGLYENWQIPYHNSAGNFSHWANPTGIPWWELD